MTHTLGERIRQLRKSHKYTIVQFAKLTDSSKGYIFELEHGDNKNPTINKLLKITEVLKTTIEYLITGSFKSFENIELEDQLFFIKYQKANAKEKERLRKILDILID